MDISIDASAFDMSFEPSIEDTLETLSKMGKKVATNPDRPKDIKDKLKRKEYFCGDCKHLVARCATADCGAFAKVTAYGVDCYCFKCLVDMRNEALEPPNNQHRVSQQDLLASSMLLHPSMGGRHLGPLGPL